MKLSEQILDRVKTRVANHTWPVKQGWTPVVRWRYTCCGEVPR